MGMFPMVKCDRTTGGCSDCGALFRNPIAGDCGIGRRRGNWTATGLRRAFRLCGVPQ